jgi:hypothetical protein
MIGIDFYITNTMQIAHVIPLHLCSIYYEEAAGIFFGQQFFFAFKFF